MMNWVLAYFTASAVPLLYGMEVGATSDLMRLIAEKRVMPEGDDWMMELNALQFGLITSSALLGAVMGMEVFERGEGQVWYESCLFVSIAEGALDR